MVGVCEAAMPPMMRAMSVLLRTVDRKTAVFRPAAGSKRTVLRGLPPARRFVRILVIGCNAAHVAPQPLLVQIQAALDAPADLVTYLSLPQKLIEARALGGDQRELHAMHAGGSGEAVPVGIARVFELSDALPLALAPRRDDIIG